MDLIYEAQAHFYIFLIEMYLVYEKIFSESTFNFFDQQIKYLECIVQMCH